MKITMYVVVDMKSVWNPEIEAVEDVMGAVTELCPSERQAEIAMAVYKDVRPYTGYCEVKEVELEVV